MAERSLYETVKYYVIYAEDEVSSQYFVDSGLTDDQLHDLYVELGDWVLNNYQSLPKSVTTLMAYNIARIMIAITQMVSLK